MTKNLTVGNPALLILGFTLPLLTLLRTPDEIFERACRYIVINRQSIAEKKHIAQDTRSGAE